MNSVFVLLFLATVAGSTQKELYNRILVTTGFIGDEGQEDGQTSEVIDLTNPKMICKDFPKAPYQNWAAVGGLLNGKPLICGGFDGPHSFQDCFYSEGNLRQDISMTQIRSFATAVNLKDQYSNDLLWIVGGFEHIDLNTSEFVYADKKSEPGPTLDFIIAHHCMVQISDNAIYIIGGKQDGEISNKVWIANPLNNFEISKGPSMKEARYFVSGSAYQDSNGVMKIVVAGGIGSTGYTSTVEILDPSTSNTWEYGPSLPKMPFFLYAGQMVTSPDVKGVVGLLVGNDTIHPDSALVELRSGATSWTIMSQKLKYGRTMPVALAIPNDLTTCIDCGTCIADITAAATDCITELNVINCILDIIDGANPCIDCVCEVITEVGNLFGQDWSC